MWPRGHQGTTPRRASCISHTAQARAAHATPRQDRRRTAPTGNTSNGGRWVSACTHNINTDPTTDHTKKHAPTSKASTRARAMTPLKAPGATPKQRGKTPTRPRRQPDGTSASERQPFTRTNDDTQPNKRRPTSKGSRMRALARAREPKHATATKGTTKFNRRHERERATICIHKRH